MFILAGGNPWPPPLNESPENEATLDLIIGSQQHIPTQKFLWSPSPPSLFQGKAFAVGNDKKQSSRFFNFFLTFSIWLYSVAKLTCSSEPEYFILELKF